MAKRKAKKRPETATELRIGARELAAMLTVAAAVVAAAAVAWRLTGDANDAGVPLASGGPAASSRGIETVAGPPSDETRAHEPTIAAPAMAPSAEATARARPPTSVPEPGTWFTSEGDPAIGLASAPVTIVVLSDFQCPNCREFATEILPWLRETWLRRGFVTVIHRDFAMIGDESTRAAEAAFCAGEQGRYWSYYSLLFERQSGQNLGVLNDEALGSFASDLQLETERFAECLASGRMRAKVDASTQRAIADDYEGTPTFIVNGRAVAGAISRESWEELFAAYEKDLAQATMGAP